MIGYLLPALALAALVWILLDVAIFYPAKRLHRDLLILAVHGCTLIISGGRKLTVADPSYFSAGDWIRIEP